MLFLPGYRLFVSARAGLISTLTGPAHTVSNTWEGEREVLDVKTNALLTAGVVSAYDYGVNSISQRSSVATSGSAFAAAAGWAWGYDALGQVTSATHTTDTAKNQAYQYDDIGNRKQSSLGLQPVSTTSYTPNLLNQYSAITGSEAPAAAPTYDTDGNQLSGASGAALGQTFVWDAENRLTAVKDASGAVLVSYVYDSKSRRVRRIEGTQTTLYVYHGWNCIAEYSLQESGTGLQPVIQRSYAWGLDLSGSVQGAGGVGGLLSVTHNAESGDPTFFPTYDGNGNISEYLTASGTIAAHFEYDAFGRVITSSGNTSAFDYRFSTKPQDTVTGWSYYGYRWYDAVSGRWASRDPIEEWGGINLYGILGNEAMNSIDVLGEIDEQKPINRNSDGKLQPPPNPTSDCAGHACGSKTQGGFNNEVNKPAEGELDSCADPCPEGKIKVKLYYPQDGGKPQNQDTIPEGGKQPGLDYTGGANDNVTGDPAFHAVGQQPNGKWTSQDGHGGNVYNDITNPDSHTEGYYCMLYPQNCEGKLNPPRMEQPKMITKCTCVCPTKDAAK
jgi:RHS repeat-associated protein